MLRSICPDAQSVGTPARMLVSLIAILAAMPMASAADLAMAPETKLRMTVIQWMPVEGEYRQIEAISGDLVVLSDETISVPIIGSVSVSGKNATTIGGEVAERIKAELGLITAPKVDLEVVEYPPIYVVGAVATPGQFQYRPGFIVLQALALGGGQLRPEAANDVESGIRIRADLVGTEDEIMRGLARSARLRAELDDATEITFPEDVIARQEQPAIRDVVAQEQALFDARAAATQRQSLSYDDLVVLLTAEIDGLDERVTALDGSLASLEAELAAVTKLVDSGLATVSRRTDIERLILSARADRLDQMTAILRSRQSISEAKRSQAGLRDQVHTEAARDLLLQQAALEDLYLKREMTRQLLAQLTQNASLGAGRTDLQEPTLEFAIVRSGDNGPSEMPADEFSELLPGDIVKVTLSQQSPL